MQSACPPVHRMAHAASTEDEQLFTKLMIFFFPPRNHIEYNSNGFSQSFCPWFQMGREVCKLLKEQSQPPRERWQPFDGNRSPIQRILEGTPCPQFVPLHLQCRHQLPSVRLDTPIRNKPDLETSVCGISSMWTS